MRVRLRVPLSAALLVSGVLPGLSSALAACKEELECCVHGRAVSHSLVSVVLSATPRVSREGADPAELAKVASKALAFALKESGGDPTNVTDMSSHTAAAAFDWTHPQASSVRWSREQVETRLQREKDRSVRYDHQTNYGILQQSPDRIQRGASSADAIARFGRYVELIRNRPEEAFSRCQSMDFFRAEKGAEAFFDGLLDCRPESDSKCFGRIAMLCPALNVEMGIRNMLRNPGYYDSRTKKAGPACVKFLQRSFERIAAKKEQDAVPVHVEDRRVSGRPQKALQPQNGSGSAPSTGSRTRSSGSAR